MQRHAIRNGGGGRCWLPWAASIALYQRLGIDEVWFWIAGRIEIHALRGDANERVSRSRRLPGLDLDPMRTFLDRRSAHIARRDFGEALRNAT